MVNFYSYSEQSHSTLLRKLADETPSSFLESWVPASCSRVSGEITNVLAQTPATYVFTTGTDYSHVSSLDITNIRSASLEKQVVSFYFCMIYFALVF